MTLAYTVGAVALAAIAGLWLHSGVAIAAFARTQRADAKR